MSEQTTPISPRKRYKKLLGSKLKTSLLAVLPITVIVFILCLTPLAPSNPSDILLFLVGAALLVVGMGLFDLGAEMSMNQIGEHVGKSIATYKSQWLAALICFVIGMLITIAEPDLTILANQIPGIPNAILITVVAVGVGIFMLIAFLRIYFNIKLSYLLIGLYAVVFVMAFFTPDNFLSAAFDAGGVTTGPITVPFILAAGIGISSMKKSGGSANDSFGMVALCSIGPILAVMILGMIYKIDGISQNPFEIPELHSTAELWQPFISKLPHYAKEVGLAILPITLFFFVYQSISLRLRKRVVVRILIGTLYLFAGLTLFFTGANVGFMPIGNHIGKSIVNFGMEQLLIPIGMCIGYFIIRAEPAVHVLTHQVEEASGGAISKRAVENALAIGVSTSVGLAMIRIITNISILWFVIPGYTIALLLTFAVSPFYTAIAFDSGGVASGTMAGTFLLPFAIGACEALGGNVMTDAFGIIAMVAMTPIISLQVLGLVFKRKERRHKNKEVNVDIITFDDDDGVANEFGVIEYDVSTGTASPTVVIDAANPITPARENISTEVID